MAHWRVARDHRPRRFDGKDGPPGHPDLKGFGCKGRFFFWLIAAAILAETDRCLITSRTLPQSRI
jgi:hypothetical protein